MKKALNQLRNPDGNSGLFSLCQMSVKPNFCAQGSSVRDTYCSCRLGKWDRGAYHRCWVRLQIRNKPNQNAAMTSAGTSVVSNAEADVELLAPNSERTLLDDDEAFPRLEPTLGSLFGFCLSVSVAVCEEGFRTPTPYHNVISLR